MRQDDAVAHHRRPGIADRGPDRAGGSRHLGAPADGARLRHRLPVVCALPQSHHRAERRLRPGEPPRAASATPRAREGAPGARGIARQRREVSRPAFRRPAAARRRGARARHVARPAAPGRAAVGARCARAGALARRDPRPAAAPGYHHDPRHPRPGGGAHHGRPHRGDEGRRDRADRHTRGGVPEARHALRRGFRRQDQPPAGHARGRTPHPGGRAALRVRRRRGGGRAGASHLFPSRGRAGP